MLDDEKTLTFAEIARQHLRDADGDTRMAADRLSARLRDDDELRLAIVDDAVTAFAEDAVEDQMRADRRAIWAGRTTNAKTSVSDLASGLMHSLLDFPLRNGKRLRDADREEVLEQANSYLVSARDMALKGRWLIMISERVEAGRTVGECVSEADAVALRDKAQSSIHGETRT